MISRVSFGCWAVGDHTQSQAIALQLACVLEIATFLQGILLEILEQYCGQQWLEPYGEDLNVLAVERIMFWHIHPDEDGYEDWPTVVVERPIYLLPG